MDRHLRDLQPNYPRLDVSLNRGLYALEQGDLTTAFSHFLSLGLQGDPEAQFNLGLCYSEGIGVVANLRKSLEWYVLAASSGYADAQYNLGMMYLEGNGVPQNSHKSINWLSRAAEQNHMNAQINLGAIYAKGDGVPVDLKRALKWLRSAAKHGSGVAQFYLGVMYYNGEGTKQSKTSAYVWWNISASISGNENSLKGRSMLEQSMSLTEISEARQVSREIFTEHVELTVQ